MQGVYNENEDQKKKDFLKVIQTALETNKQDQSRQQQQQVQNETAAAWKIKRTISIINTFVGN